MHVTIGVAIDAETAVAVGSMEPGEATVHIAGPTTSVALFGTLGDLRTLARRILDGTPADTGAQMRLELVK